MKSLLVIFLGGGLGSMARYGMARWISGLHLHHFPFGTLAVNVAACFILGGLVGWGEHKQLVSADMRNFWTIGFCGGFSTFSTFSIEALYLLQGGGTFSAFLYVALSIILCLAAVWAGIYLGQLL